MIKITLVLSAFLCFTIVSVCHSSLFDATEDLEGKTVIYAGEVESLSCPYGGKYDCSTWPTGLLKFKYKNLCFTAGIAACNYFCNGFIAVGKEKIPYFFVMKDIGGGIDKEVVQLYKCPDMY